MKAIRRTLHLNILILFALGAALQSCSLVTSPVPPVATSQDAPRASATLAPPQVRTALPSPSASPTALPTDTPIPSQTATATITHTPDPYGAYTMEYLVNRDYGGGELQIVETLDVNSFFTRTLVAYPSDGLTMVGFMDVPQEGRRVYTPSGGLAVVITLHGYVPTEGYNTLTYTTGYADALARAGFLVIHPNLRGYPPSQDGDNLFRVGMAIDILNLLAVIQEQAGKLGVLALADPNAIGIWGHSMGGGISTRVITASPQVRAAVLYGAMSGDEQLNYERIYNYFSDRTRGLEELNTPADVLLRISPIYFLERIQAAVSIHHGKSDSEVPLAWSMDLCQRLQDLGKTVECFTYDGQPHTFYGDGDQLFVQRMTDFFDRILRQP